MLRYWATSLTYGMHTGSYSSSEGRLTSSSFESVTDRFLTELGPIAAGQVAKDADMKYENLVKGLRHVNIKVSPYNLYSSSTSS